MSSEKRPLMVVELFPLDPEAAERGTLLQARHHPLIRHRPLGVGRLVGHVGYQLDNGGEKNALNPSLDRLVPGRPKAGWSRAEFAGALLK